MKLSDTLLQCLKGLSTQKDGTRIHMTIDLWYDHGQDPAMLTFNQGAMREHLRLCLQAKSSRRLKIVFTAEPKILPAYISIHFVYTVSFVLLPNIGLTILLLLPNSSTLPLLNFSN